MSLIKNLLIFFKLTKLNKKVIRFKNSNSGKKILVEFNHLCVQHICFAQLINAILKKKNCSVHSYTGYSLLAHSLFPSKFKKVIFYIGALFGIKNFGIYKSFGTSKFFYPKIDEEIEKKVKGFYKNFRKKIKDRKAILNLKIDGIYIGDLLYDTYLKSKRTLQPTIDLDSDEFNIFLRDFLRLHFYWVNYFNVNDVEAIIGSHSVYTIGLPLRIAASKNIKALVVGENYLMKVTNQNLHWANETKNFKKIFDSLSKKNKSKYLRFSKLKFIERFGGKSSVRDMPYMTSSPYKKNKIKLKLKKTKKKRILIMPHDFIDATHVYGKNIFPDFYQWIIFLAKLSFETQNQYEWFVKLHPKRKTSWAMYSDYNENVLRNILKKQKNSIKIIDSNTSHFEVLNNNFDFILTVFGTVATEYAYFNKYVINASINNPHNSFNFSLSPKNISEYKKLILNLKKINFKINKKEILKYFFMRNYYTNRNCFFEDYGEMLKKVGYHEQWTYKMYSYWVENFNIESFEKNSKYLENFIQKKDNFFSIKHKPFNF